LLIVTEATSARTKGDKKNCESNPVARSIPSRAAPKNHYYSDRRSCITHGEEYGLRNGKTTDGVQGLVGTHVWGAERGSELPSDGTRKANLRTNHK